MDRGGHDHQSILMDGHDHGHQILSMDGTVLAQLSRGWAQSQLKTKIRLPMHQKSEV